MGGEGRRWWRERPSVGSGIYLTYFCMPSASRPLTTHQREDGSLCSDKSIRKEEGICGYLPVIENRKIQRNVTMHFCALDMNGRDQLCETCNEDGIDIIFYTQAGLRAHNPPPKCEAEWRRRPLGPKDVVQCPGDGSQSEQPLPSGTTCTRPKAYHVEWRMTDGTPKREGGVE